jgi:hypothetical protein
LSLLEKTETVQGASTVGASSAAIVTFPSTLAT